MIEGDVVHPVRGRVVWNEEFWSFMVRVDDAHFSATVRVGKCIPDSMVIGSDRKVLDAIQPLFHVCAVF